MVWRFLIFLGLAATAFVAKPVSAAEITLLCQDDKDEFSILIDTELKKVIDLGLAAVGSEDGEGHGVETTRFTKLSISAAQRWAFEDGSGSEIVIFNVDRATGKYNISWFIKSANDPKNPKVTFDHGLCHRIERRF